MSIFQLNLGCQIFNSTFRARSFYAHVLNCEVSDDFAFYKNTLIDRVKNSFSLHKDFSLRKFNSDFKYVNCINHGICDSVQTVLFQNHFLECDDIGTIGPLLRLFWQSFCFMLFQHFINLFIFSILGGFEEINRWKLTQFTWRHHQNNLRCTILVGNVSARYSVKCAF